MCLRPLPDEEQIICLIQTNKQNNCRLINSIYKFSPHDGDDDNQASTTKKQKKMFNSMPRFLPRDDAVSHVNHAVIISLLKLAKHPGITAEIRATLERKSSQPTNAVPYCSLSLLKLNKHQSLSLIHI